MAILKHPQSQHTCFSKTNELNEICNSYFNKTPIKFMHYMKNYDDNKFVTICTNKEWLLHFFEKKYYEMSAARGKSSNCEEKIILTENLQRASPIAEDAKRLFGIGPGIFFYKTWKWFY